MTATEHPAPQSSPTTGLLVRLCARVGLDVTGAPRRRASLAAVAALAILAALALSAAPALAAGVGGTCINESVRLENELFRKTSLEEQLSKPVASVVSLPDCRAYEMLTPPFKDGWAPEPGQFSFDGSSMLESEFGAFAGVEADSKTQGAHYRMSRSAMGWGTSPISPPASGLPAQELLAATPDLGRTLWRARTAQQSIYAEDLYLREADGRLVRIGPMIPPAAETGEPAGGAQEFFYSSHNRSGYLDSSADLSHVFFHIDAVEAHWPGDLTGPPNSEVGISLYEYVQGASRPELVAIDPEGLPMKTCGTFLGSVKSEDLYNAVSPDGKTVFFTAVPRGTSECGESELFARLDGQQTVSISEPSPAQCSACLTPATKELGRASAEFVGASEDGSKVFFQTGQELLPAARGANLYEYDFDNPPSTGKDPTGKIVRLSTGSEEPEVQGVARVSEDGSHVYFVAKGRLTAEARGAGCLTSLSPAEKTEEEQAEAEEAEKAAKDEKEPASKSKTCNPKRFAENLYGFERDASYPAGRLTFIATLSEADSGDWSPSDQRPVQATPDGRFLAFASSADLTPAQASAATQIFEYDAHTEELVRVSRSQPGYVPEPGLGADESEAQLPAQGFGFSTDPSASDTALAVSADGATVVFSDTGSLTDGAEGAARAHAASVYVYRNDVVSAGSISEGNVFLISDGVNTVGDVALGTDPGGQDIWFSTVDPLVPTDSDEQWDVYDARIDGGFPAADPSTACVSEACPHQGAGPAQAPAGALTAVIPASANPTASSPPPMPPRQSPARKTAPVRCARNKRRVHRRCLKSITTRHRIRPTVRRAAHGNGRRHR